MNTEIHLEVICASQTVLASWQFGKSHLEKTRIIVELSVEELLCSFHTNNACFYVPSEEKMKKNKLAPGECGTFQKKKKKINNNTHN